MIRAWPPLDYLAGLNTRIKDSWETRTAECRAPRGGTQLQAVWPRSTCRSTRSGDLAEEGFTVDDADGRSRDRPPEWRCPRRQMAAIRIT